MYDEVDDADLEAMYEEYEAAMAGQRRGREELVDDTGYESDDGSPPEQKRRVGDGKSASGGNAVQVFAWRWSWSPRLGMDLTEFKAAVPHLRSALVAAGGSEAKYMFQLELTGDSNWHYQGYFRVPKGRRMRPLQLGGMLGDEFKGINVQAASKAGCMELRRYCMKKETRQAGPWADCEIEEEYDGSDLPGILRPWQSTVVADLATVPDDRTINWVVDEAGSSGKSKLVKKLMFENKAVYHTIADVKDTLCAVVKEGPKRAYLFDCPRTKSKKVHIDELYSALESIKNGLVRAQKWENKSLIMKSPHVWVFSNYKPDRSKMTADRFKVFTINQVGDPSTWRLVEMAPAAASNA